MEPGKFLLVESGILGLSGIQLKESGIPLRLDQNPSFTVKDWNTAPGIRNPRCGIQNPRLSWISFRFSGFPVLKRPVEIPGAVAKILPGVSSQRMHPSSVTSQSREGKKTVNWIFTGDNVCKLVIFFFERRFVHSVGDNLQSYLPKKKRANLSLAFSIYLRVPGNLLCSNLTNSQKKLLIVWE